MAKTMIVEMKNTTTAKIAKKLQDLRETGGVVALGRVLSLLVEIDPQNLEEAIKTANAASRLHPSRIIVLAKNESGLANLDAEIRVGGDAGASEVVVLRASGEVLSNIESLVSGLLLPDAPIVAWWPADCPINPAETELGRIAGRRITNAANESNSVSLLALLAENYAQGDGDMAWTRITLWRSQVAALLDQHFGHPIKRIMVYGSSASPSTHLLSSWLGLKLQANVEIVEKIGDAEVSGVAGIEIEFENSRLRIIRSGQVAVIEQTDLPTTSVLLPPRSDLDCLIEDLRFLGEDKEYAEVLRNGFSDAN